MDTLCSASFGYELFVGWHSMEKWGKQIAQSRRHMNHVANSSREALLTIPSVDDQVSAARPLSSARLDPARLGFARQIWQPSRDSAQILGPHADGALVPIRHFWLPMGMFRVLQRTVRQEGLVVTNPLPSLFCARPPLSRRAATRPTAQPKPIRLRLPPIRASRRPAPRPPVLQPQA